MNLIALSVIALSACGSDPEPYLAPEGRTFKAETHRMALRQVPQMYASTGSVVSDERVEISSRVAAFVRKIEVHEGERLQRGQLIASLDSQDIDASIRAATSVRNQARAARADAVRDLEDGARLFARELVSEAHQRKAKLALSAAADALQVSEAELSRWQSERQNTQILSPVAGMVVARHRRAGDLVTPGMPLLTVESDTALLFETEVPEQRVAAIKLGDKVAVHIDALKRSLTGEVVRRVASGDPVTRGFQVKIALPSTGGLLPGMFGRARFTLGTRQALLVPSSALTERGGLSGVYVVDPENHRLDFRWLRTGKRFENGLIVEAGLDPGETVIQAVPAAMRDGDFVQPVSKGL